MTQNKTHTPWILYRKYIHHKFLLAEDKLPHTVFLSYDSLLNVQNKNKAIQKSYRLKVDMQRLSCVTLFFQSRIILAPAQLLVLTELVIGSFEKFI